MNRRQFLSRAGLLGGAAVGAAALQGCGWTTEFPGTGTLGSIVSKPANQAPIDHIVVVMMENRSFDHYLGHLAGDSAYLSTGMSRWGSGFHVDGQVDQSFPDADGNPVSTEHLTTDPDQTSPFQGCGFNDPGHGWDDGRAERDHGFLATASGNDEFALGYYDGGDLPFTEAFAREYTLCDNYHASVLGPTFPNRYYLHSAQSGGKKDNSFPPAGGWTWPLIWDKLTAANVPCRYYYSDLPILALFGTRGTAVSSPIAQYFDACTNGTLPNVVMIDPNFAGVNQCDDHPLADVRGGQRFLRNAFKAFVESPHWQHGAFIVTYDEWGGFFDHVAPPHLPDPRRSANDEDDFSQAGFRVPTMMASPYARNGFVDHRTYDHSSILRFIEWRFLGAPAEGPQWSKALTLRDQNAYNIGASLAPTIVSAEPTFDLDMNLDPPLAPCAAPGGAAAFRAATPRTGGDDAFDVAEWNAYLDREGLPTV